MSLLFHGCPADITRFITFVIINPVNRVFGSRFWTKFFFEQQKVFLKAIRHCYTSTSIIMKFSLIRITAPSFCRCPDFVEFAGILTMLERSFYKCFSSLATATWRTPIFKGESQNVSDRTTVTFAKPACIVASIESIGPRHYNPFSKSLTSKIVFVFIHRWRIYDFWTVCNNYFWQIKTVAQ